MFFELSPWRYGNCRGCPMLDVFRTVVRPFCDFDGIVTFIITPWLYSSHDSMPWCFCVRAVHFAPCVDEFRIWDLKTVVTSLFFVFHIIIFTILIIYNHIGACKMIARGILFLWSFFMVYIPESKQQLRTTLYEIIHTDTIYCTL